MDLDLGSKRARKLIRDHDLTEEEILQIVASARINLATFDPDYRANVTQIADELNKSRPTIYGWADRALAATIHCRETARYRGGSITALQYRQLFRALSLVFLGVALLGGGGLWQVSDFLATRWLNVKEIAPNDVILAVQIMCVSVALRWMGGLYRGVVTGSEQLV